MALSVRKLESLTAGKWISDQPQHGAGALSARRLKSQSVRFYYRYVDGAGKRDALPLGLFDRNGLNGITLAEAHERAGELSRRYMAGQKNLRVVLEAESRLTAVEAEKQIREQNDKAASTLGVLLGAYADQLECDGKESFREVRSSVRLHIEKPWPMLWAKPAVEIETREVLAIVARVVEQGKRRQADKLRGWIRAAYSTAIQAHMDVSYSQKLRDLDIWSNPARDLAVVKGARNVRDRFLTLSELQAYWRRLKRLGQPYGPLLRFHLLTGAQRPRQLKRLLESDYDASDQFVIINDGKGRRERPRKHVVPLIPAAVEELAAMAGGKAGPFIFTINRGRRGADDWTVRDGVRQVVAEMLAAGEIDARFTPGAIRTTVETRLAAAKITKDVRGQLQSHGLSGIQDRHYDMYDYFDEKKEALQLLYSMLEPTK